MKRPDIKDNNLFKSKFSGVLVNAIVILFVLIAITLFLFWSYDIGLEHVKSIIIYNYLEISRSVKKDLTDKQSLQIQMEQSLSDLLYKFGISLLRDNDLKYYPDNIAIMDSAGKFKCFSTKDIDKQQFRDIAGRMKLNNADELFFHIDSIIWGYMLYDNNSKGYFFTSYRYPFLWLSDDKGIIADFVKNYQNDYVVYAFYQDSVGIVASAGLPDTLIYGIIYELGEKSIKTNYIEYMEYRGILNVAIPIDSFSFVGMGFSMKPFYDYRQNVRNLYVMGLILSVFLIILGMVSVILLLKWIKLYEQIKEKEVKERSLEEIGNMAAWTAHEIRNPLNAIRMGIDSIEENNENKDILNILRFEIGRISNIVDNFLSMVKNNKGQKTFLKDIIEKTVATIRMEYPDVNVDLEKIDEMLCWYIDENISVSIFSNIIRNAIEANAKNIYIDYKEGLLSICNDGEPISGEIGERIFRRYETTKSYGNGIGLAMVKTVLMKNGMDIKWTNNKEGNVCFIIKMNGKECSL